MSTERRKLNILVIYAHSADAACEAAGTLALHADQGDTITYVICSDGERHHNSLFLDDEEAPGKRHKEFVRATMDDIKATKREEVRRVAEIIGAKDIIFLGWPDDHMLISQERIDQLGEIILQVRPDVLLTHLPWKGASQVDPHTRVGQMAVAGALVAETRVRQVDGVASHLVKDTYFFPFGQEIAQSRDMLADGIVCDVWVDITPVVERKVRAIDQIVSQGYHGQTARKIVESREGDWGKLAGCSYAEPFVSRMAHVHALLPVSERALGRKYAPNALPGDQLIAHKVPLASPTDYLKVGS